MGNRDGSAKKYRNKGRLDWYLVQWSIPATFQSIVLHVWERLAVQERLFINICNYELVTATTLILQKYMVRRSNNRQKRK